MTPSRIGRYEVQRRLGGGGMGDLYLALDPGLERLVAIKVLKADLQEDPGLRERFLREARAVARLSHSNIVMVFEVDEERLFMAMEYIAGQTLKKILYQTPSLPVTKRLSFVEDLCAGLAHAHRANIIHRDIKPENIMLGSDGVVKILDFGIARLGNSGMTQEGMMMGTLNYMSPEQVTGHGVGLQTDIFATGAVLYEAISLKQAFPGQGIDSGVLHRILYEGPVPLNQIVPAIDPELLKVVQRALHRDPAQRYQDANDMRRDILRVRRRLMDEAAPGLLDSTQATTTAEPARPPSTASGRKSDSDRPRRLNPERFAELRRQQVDEHLRFGEEALAQDDHDAALHHAERAAMVDPDSRAAFDLIDRARFAIEARAVRQLLAKAQRLLSDGQLEDAAAMAEEASVTFPDVHGAAELRNDVRETVEKIAAARERAQRIASGLERARSSIDRGGYETALRAVYEVLAIDPDQAMARQLEQEAKSRLQAQREHERARQGAYDQLTRARALAEAGDFDEAVDVASAVSPPSDTVRAAVADVLAAVLKSQRHAAQAAVVAKAREAFERSRLDEALAAIDSIPADDRTSEAKTLRTAVERALRQQRELERKQKALDAALVVVHGLIEVGDFTRALERLEDAARIGVEDPRIPSTRQRITNLAAAAEERRRQEARDRLAAKRVEAAQELLANGNGYAAVALLERDGAVHPLVEEALRNIRAAIAEQEERVRQEAERRRQEEETRRRAQAEAARKAEDARKAEEQRRRQEDERLRRDAEQQRLREEVATLLVSAERALAKDRPDEATLFLKRADEEAAAVEDSALRRRLEAAKVEAERLERARQEAIRKREEEARERERALTELVAKARAIPAHDAALDLLDEALTLAPGDTRVQTLVQERRSALEQQRAEEERVRQEALRQAEIDAARVREEEARRREEDARRRAEDARRVEEEARRRDEIQKREAMAREQEARRQAELEAARKAEEQRQTEEQRRRDEEARKREDALTLMLTQAGSAAEHDAALTILAQAQTLAPGDSRVRTLIQSRRAALDAQRVEAAARAAEEAAQVERERVAQRERDEHAATVVRQAQQLFTSGRHEEALTLLNQSPVHTLTRTTLEDLQRQRTEIERRREREARSRQRQERRAATLAGLSGVARDRRVHIAAVVVFAIVAGVGTWQFWPARQVQPPVQPPPSLPDPPPVQPPNPVTTVPPLPATGGDGQAAQALQRAQKLYAERQRPAALAQLRLGLSRDASSREGQALLNSMLGDARKEMQQAKDEAVNAGAQTEQVPSYRQAVDSENEGQRAFSANRRIDALPLWWSASDEFTTAAGEARAVADARQRAAAAEKAKQDAELKEKLDRENAARDREAATARELAQKIEEERKRQEAIRAADDARKAREARRQADVLAIRRTLQGYESAWASLNPDAVLALHPLSGADEANVRRTMNDAREYRLVVQDPNVQLDADGQRATVTANVIRSITPRVARAITTTTPTVFTLAKRGDTWVIVSMTAR